jgi:O-antigen ligase
LPAIIMAGVLGAALLAGFANRLPIPLQRTLTFLPAQWLDLDMTARLDAQGSSDWRIEMWKDVLPQVPRYLLVGKGYGIDARELASVRSDAFRGRDPWGGSELAGDYHNGPLSVIVPFGIFGVLAFVWFLVASCRVLVRNYQFGDPAYHRVNTFLFAYFVVKTIFFFTVFGSLYSDLALFTGVIGLSVSLNGGVAKPAAEPVPEPELALGRFRLPPGTRRPVGA